VLTEPVEYRHGGVVLEGILARDERLAGRRPGVLIAHAWGGRDEFVVGRARAFAGLGYAGFALDMYGKGVRGGSPEENARLMQPLLDDRALLRGRIGAALETLQRIDVVDPERIAAIGFCFGGLCALDLARGGADLRGVISVHGLLHPAEGLAGGAIRARVLALHGHDDPLVPPDQVLAFEREMTAAGADWQVHVYGRTRHAFTNPAANDPGRGTVYDERADRRSWRTIVAFLEENFSSGQRIP
jgi:dienelactone hydrolase